MDLELPREFNKVRQCATTLDSFQEGAGRTACMCGLHFHILHFDPAQYPMMEHIRRSRQDRKVRKKDGLALVDFDRDVVPNGHGVRRLFDALDPPCSSGALISSPADTHRRRRELPYRDCVGWECAVF